MVNGQTNGALAVREPVQAVTPFQPQGLEQAMKLAEVLARSGLLPDALRNKPSDVLVTLITGHELGLSPMQSVRGLHVVQGRAVMSADLTVALVMRRRDVCEWFRLVKSDDKAAEYQTKRVGSEPVTMRYTIEQASQAGLTGKQNWKTHTAAMLRARCSAALARAVYPDLVLGVYDPDEADEFKAPPRTVPPPTPVHVVSTESESPAAPLEEVAEILDAAVQDPAPQPDPADPLAEIKLAIACAEDRPALNRLLGAIRRLPENLQGEAKRIYSERAKEIK